MAPSSLVAEIKMRRTQHDMRRWEQSNKPFLVLGT